MESRPRKSPLTPLSPEEYRAVVCWMREFTLSKPIKNISRDMSDGVMVAEILKNLFPKMVELHNYARCNSTQNKLSNWETLNRKVLRRLNIFLDKRMMQDLASGNNGTLEILLHELMIRHRQMNDNGNNGIEPSPQAPCIMLR
ncbi:sperm flagellar protein 1-like [Anopheles albimanus]|uniref:Calponin-homology (CH) domain-containing protein n=1 Tax=Anopheles albimanus TaxID=7167 RepID=A0A182F3H3_ANOAL|nr:sperm flagellar protein 1-like [Anopheles albimanus]